MKLYLKIFLVTLVSISLNSLWTGCNYYVEDELNPDPLAGCDTVAVSYANDLVPILESNCYGCHAAATSAAGAGIVLDNHGGVSTFANIGRLLCVVSFGDGCSPMPPSGAQISACDIALIDHWIIDGAPNN